MPNVVMWQDGDLLTTYCKIQDVLSNCIFDEDTVAKIPIPRKTQLVKSGVKFKSVFLALQDVGVSLDQARKQFVVSFNYMHK